MSGNIIDWFDEANGGWIIRKYQVVNPERFNEIQKKQKDKEEAAKVLGQAIADPASFRNPEASADREVAPSKVADLEKRVNNMQEGIDKILEFLNPKKDDHQPIRDEEKM